MKTKRKFVPKSIPIAGDSTVGFSADADRISNVNWNVSNVATNVVSYPGTSHSFPMSQSMR
ncbi:hypothetical protein Tco_1021871, partial [Tanacetum coccineum]